MIVNEQAESVRKGQRAGPFRRPREGQSSRSFQLRMPGERPIVPNVSSTGQRSKLSAAELSGLGPVFGQLSRRQLSRIQHRWFTREVS
jgi:hypothetical protein